jgi:hypothetical protein
MEGNKIIRNETGGNQFFFHKWVNWKICQPEILKISLHLKLERFFFLVSPSRALVSRF